MRCLFILLSFIRVSALYACFSVTKELPPNPFHNIPSGHVQDKKILDLLDLLGHVTEWYEPHLITVLPTLIELGDSDLLDRVVFDPRFKVDDVVYMACKHLNHDIIRFLVNHPMNLVPEEIRVLAFRWVLQSTKKYRRREEHCNVSYTDSFQLWLKDYFKMMEIWRSLIQKPYSNVSAQLIEAAVLTEINNQLTFLNGYGELEAFDAEIIVDVTLSMFKSNDAFPVLHTNRLLPSYWYGFVARLMNYNHLKGFLKILTKWPQFIARIDLSAHPVNAPSLLKASTRCAPIYCIALTMQAEVFESTLTSIQADNDSEAMTVLRRDSRKVYDSLRACSIEDAGVETHVHTMSIDYRDSVSVQACCLLSPYARVPFDVRIDNAIAKPRAYLSQIVLKAASLAGLLRYDHVPLIYAAGFPAEVCNVIDENLPLADLSRLYYPKEGNVILVMSYLRARGSLNIRGLVYELLAHSVEMGCLGFLRRLNFIMRICERERQQEFSQND